nr:hypothetical protein [Algoriphagus terrigena]
MRNLIEILGKAALLGFFIAFMACSNDDGQDVSGGNEVFTGDVAGVGTIAASKDYDTVSGTKIAAGGNNIVVLQGTDNSGKGFMIRLSTTMVRASTRWALPTSPTPRPTSVVPRWANSIPPLSKELQERSLWILTMTSASKAPLSLSEK